MHSQNAPETRYLSYLLRSWRTSDGNDKAVWCTSLQEPGSRHTHSFGDADELFIFLQSQLGNVGKSGAQSMRPGVA